MGPRGWGLAVLLLETLTGAWGWRLAPPRLLRPGRSYTVPFTTGVRARGDVACKQGKGGFGFAKKPKEFK
jgi:hypothetical protein